MILNSNMLSREAPSWATRLHPGVHVLVGCESEMEELSGAVESARSGHGRLVLLYGEPGIGKTRLAQEVASFARTAGPLVLWGRGWESGGASSYWPWIQVIRDYIEDVDAARLAREMKDGAAYVAQVVPEVGRRLGSLPAPRTPLSPDPERERFALFDAVSTFLCNAAATHPLVLLLEDLHAFDTQSLRLLEFLAPRLNEVPMLVVGTYREAELRRAPRLARVVGELARYSEGLPLTGLSEAETTRLVENTLGVAPPVDLASALYRASSGNPFFVSEVARALNAERRRYGPELKSAGDLRVPHRVREAIRRRVDLLGGECGGVMEVAAVIGHEFDLAILRDVPGSTQGVEGRLEAILAEAVADGIVLCVPATLGRYRFVHSLVREVLYDEIPAPRRRVFHRQVGEALQARHAANPEPHLSQLAHHFVEALPGGDAAIAVDYAARAGERAMGLLAYEDGVGHFERALQVLEVTGAPDDAMQRCELLLSLADAHRKAGDSPKAEEIFYTAAELARGLAAPEMLARAALGFPPGVTLGKVDQKRVSLLEETLATLGEEDSATRSRLLARLAWELYWSNTRDRRVAMSEQAVEMARRIGDPSALAYALDARCYALWSPQSTHQRLEDSTEMLCLAEESGDRELACEGHHWRVIAFVELGDIVAVDREIEAYARLATEIRQPLYLWWLALWKGMRAMLAGRFDEAERLSTEAFAIGERVRGESAQAAFFAQMYAILQERGCFEEVLAGVEAFAKETPYFADEHPSLRCALAQTYSGLGREAEARREFDHLVQDDFAIVLRGALQPQFDPNWLSTMMLLVEACAYLADDARAAVLYDLLSPYAERIMVNGPGLSCLGSVRHGLGLLATTMGRWDEAQDHFEEALRLGERMQSPPMIARGQCFYAGMLVARGNPSDVDRALGLAEESLATAERLGMAYVAKSAEALRSRIQDEGGQPRAALTVAGAEPASGRKVFGREGEYWSITFEGSVIRLRDTKGLRYIAHLVRHPGEEIHALDLVSAADPAADPGARLLQAGTGPQLDAEAVAAYRDRLRELRADLDEAEGFNDLGRAERLRAEIEWITGQLAGAVGLGGRARPSGSAAERARLAVTKRIKAAVRKIGKSSSALGDHLATSIRTGNFCVYGPHVDDPAPWTE